ncbi:MAG: indole-3-glycerol phosphate synthase TrpC [Deltaproteobacteria bacterium]|nr:indole-3-glycerol phosphate synthase TrpC [Deltaproteobacteria bacterium]
MPSDEQTPDILTQILRHEEQVVASARAARPVQDLRGDPAFALERRSLRQALAGHRPSVIAECKRRSPSKGVLREPYDPVAIALGYAAAGAAAISVLTNERFFGGSLDDLRAVRANVPVPVLRKDFVIDEYQLDEARAAGADAVLLIVAALPVARLGALYRAARERGLDVLTEVHDEAELEIALGIGAGIVGVNNRNLRTFVTDLAVSERIARLVPEGTVLVAESGLRDGADLARLQRSGIQAFLIGEAFMTAPVPGEALAAMLAGAVER